MMFHRNFFRHGTVMVSGAAAFSPVAVRLPTESARRIRAGRRAGGFSHGRRGADRRVSFDTRRGQGNPSAPGPATRPRDPVQCRQAAASVGGRAAPPPQGRRRPSSRFFLRGRWTGGGGRTAACGSTWGERIACFRRTRRPQRSGRRLTGGGEGGSALSGAMARPAERRAGPRRAPTSAPAGVWTLACFSRRLDAGRRRIRICGCITTTRRVPPAGPDSQGADSRPPL